MTQFHSDALPDPDALPLRLRAVEWDPLRDLDLDRDGDREPDRELRADEREPLRERDPDRERDLELPECDRGRDVDRLA